MANADTFDLMGSAFNHEQWEKLIKILYLY
jgi:hypothetical protein